MFPCSPPACIAAVAMTKAAANRLLEVGEFDVCTKGSLATAKRTGADIVTAFVSLWDPAAIHPRGFVP
jgi:hypothetical protein